MFTNNEMNKIFHALAHGTRRTILDLLRDQPGQGVGELAKSFDVTRIAVMNHLAVLESAGLITSEKRGRKRHLYLNAAPIQMINDRWVNEFSGYWSSKLTAIKYAAERAARVEEQKK